jgi:schlafen family protein
MRGDKMKRSYYSNSIPQFLLDDEKRILGDLALNHSHALEDLQKNAWIKQIVILKHALKNIPNGQIYFEFEIPRMGKRVDNILIIEDLIFVLEFKIGEKLYQKYAIEQVVDYCLDLQNFHEGSHKEKLVPILVATQGVDISNKFEVIDNLFEPLKANYHNLTQVISDTLSLRGSIAINVLSWENSIYKPTPTIIEAAQALYRGHNVEEISRNDAGAINLSITTNCINQIIDRAKNRNEKSICFLTGVPGAGKTLAGLNIANERKKIDEKDHAVFLSGNGPLVAVLREALTRDNIKTSKENGEKLIKKDAERKAKSFIQNIHHFRDDNLKSQNAPIEKIVVFDEAQRAWAKEQVGSFMKRKKGIEDFNMSEPEFLISVMDRHSSWCTIICLIGGGQEINVGEAGVSEWLSSLKKNYADWNIYYSNLICSDENYLSDKNLKDWLQKVGNENHELHLGICVRSFRSEKISLLIDKVLKGNAIEVNHILNLTKDDFPFYLTRDLAIAKKWLREKAKGSERIGIVASSGSRRLRPLGIDVKNEVSAPIWFLNNSDDVRSSNYLEEVATEFDIQGLEIDWVCLAWDINYYFNGGQWNCQNFEGTTWRQIHQPEARNYLQNAYRVLLTRARQGLIIYIPEGDDLDHTRPKGFYDSTYQYFKMCGIPSI